MSGAWSLKARWSLAVIAIGICALTSARDADGEVRSVVVTARQEVLGGRYEKLAGVVHLEVDPAHPANAAIVDLPRAPRNARGRVEASADFMALRPRRPPARGSTALVEISNRGGTAALPYLAGGGQHFVGRFPPSERVGAAYRGNRSTSS